MIYSKMLNLKSAHLFSDSLKTFLNQLQKITTSGK